MNHKGVDLLAEARRYWPSVRNSPAQPLPEIVFRRRHLGQGTTGRAPSF